MSVLVILEQNRGAYHRMSWDALAAASELEMEVVCATVGEPGEAAGKRASKLFCVKHALLGEYSADAYTAALEHLIRQVAPQVVLFPHTYQVRDYAPKLATRMGRVFLADAIKLRSDGSEIVVVRQLFQGKLNADYRISGEGPHFISVQAGAYRGDAVASGSPAVEEFLPGIDAGAVRARSEAPFRESARAVDLTAAELIVSVGRGIREAENIPLVEELAKALGAEMAASRPICDNGWMPMERQVGSSGQTVAPKVYFAVGISGAIQHLVGMKGSKAIVAINKDPDAPIFEVADYGIVGDLFEVVPALTDAVKQAKGG
jgi:electron transfer flavoprotein alpha subunit